MENKMRKPDNKTKTKENKERKWPECQNKNVAKIEPNEMQHAPRAEDHATRHEANMQP